MKYSDFIKNVAESTSLSQQKTKEVLSTVTDTIIRTVANGDEIALPQFGKFKLKTKAAHKGVNPATGAKVDIPESKTITFKVSSQVKSDLNG